ncbi:histidine triad nucleotide-binding protein [Caldicellulosiruptoraceae bacterium PP1]
MDDCIFCKIISKSIPAEIVYEDDLCLAFKDINPTAPVHLLIVPKTHIESIMDIDESNINDISHILKIIPILAKKFDINNNGFRIINNCGIDAGQTVKHIHFHLLGGRKFGWPAG